MADWIFFTKAASFMMIIYIEVLDAMQSTIGYPLPAHMRTYCRYPSADLRGRKPEHHVDICVD